MRLTVAAVAVAFVTAVTACAGGGELNLPPRATVAVSPDPDAPPEPAAAGPVTTTTTLPITTTSLPGSIEYVVEPGDTFYAIATRSGATVELLLTLNPLKDPGNLIVGQILIVPGPGTAGGAPGAAVTDNGAGPAAGVTTSTLPAATSDG
jgi:LysM repeat protein